MSNAAVIEKDLVIVGAGPAGLSLAACVARSGLAVAVVDRQTLGSIEAPQLDGRDIALTHLSQAILEEIGVWRHFDPAQVHPLKEATVQDGNNPYALHFERTDDDEAPLGYLVANHRIRQALYEEVREHRNIELLLEQEVKALSSDDHAARVLLADGRVLQAPLAVAADSRFSATRRMMGIGAKMKDYGRVMIVCNMHHSLSHRNTAQEWFQYGRTCAILPLGEGESSIVITVPATQASHLTGLSPQAFAAEVETLLEGRLGTMTLVTERFPYPLVGAYADRFVGKRFALLGDAAVGMHPVTAHGYNLGLRSADTLASQIIKARHSGRDIGSASVLKAYELRHQLLARPLYESTNLIVRLFNDDRPLAKLARKVAVRVGNNIAPFKKLVTQRLTQIR